MNNNNNNQSASNSGSSSGTTTTNPPPPPPKKRRPPRRRRRPPAAAAATTTALSATASPFVPTTAVTSTPTPTPTPTTAIKPKKKPRNRNRKNNNNNNNPPTTPLPVEQKQQPPTTTTTIQPPHPRPPPSSKKKRAPASSSSASSSSSKFTANAPRLANEFESKNAQLASTLIAQLAEDVYDCSICMERIGRRGKTWSCPRCFIIIHLTCVRTWAESTPGNEFLCPGCLHTLSRAPTEYVCFCGNTVDPAYDAYLTPHACSQVCGKLRGHGCLHPCTMMCHPGSCPPCAANVQRTCYCGDATFMERCGVAWNGRSCDKVCDRLLNCGVHRCTQACHGGDCDSCQHIITKTCHCGRQQRDMVCDGNQSFSCATLCGAALECGNHVCRLPCHDGPHQLCDRQPQSPQPCACGAHVTTVQRPSCLTPIPVCGDECGRVLSCGRHTCTRVCHDSPCDPCAATIAVSCACGRRKKPVRCELADDHEFQCQKRCQQLMSCGRHKCSRVCCVGGADAHLCLRVCDRPLNCGEHNCPMLCHLGHCSECPIVLQNGVACTCGKSRIARPVPCGTPAPLCKEPCCEKRECGHACLYTCHPPPCSKCSVLVKRMCSGGHREMENIPCHVTNVSCGAPCGKLRECGQHTCRRLCHAGSCDTTTTKSKAKANASNIGVGGFGFSFDITAAGRVAAVSDTPLQQPPPTTTTGEEKNDHDDGALRSCGQECGRPSEECGHPCRAPCHPDSPLCPVDVLCQVHVSVTCDCGRITRRVRCHERNTMAIVCDSQCEIEERNRRLREALGPNDNRGLSRLPYPHQLLNKILDERLEDKVEKMEEILREFVQDDMSSPTLNLKAMPQMHRWLLHQLASYYGVESESYDFGVRRFVRLVKNTNNSSGPTRPCVPQMLMSQALRTYVQHNGREAAPPSSLHVLLFDNLSEFPGIRPRDLHYVLKPWYGQYRLTWLDDSQALVVFSSKDALIHAKREVDLKRVFRTRLGGDEEVDGGPVVDADGWHSSGDGGGGGGGGKASTTSGVLAAAVALPGAGGRTQVTVSTMSAFSALNDDDDDEEEEEEDGDEEDADKKETVDAPTQQPDIAGDDDGDDDWSVVPRPTSSKGKGNADAWE